MIFIIGLTLDCSKISAHSFWSTGLLLSFASWIPLKLFDTWITAMFTYDLTGLTQRPRWQQIKSWKSTAKMTANNLCPHYVSRREVFETDLSLLYDCGQSIRSDSRMTSNQNYTSDYVTRWPPLTVADIYCLTVNGRSQHWSSIWQSTIFHPSGEPPHCELVCQSVYLSCTEIGQWYSTPLEN